MSATAFIRTYILRLPRAQLFTTRNCLPLGSRASVDQVLCRFVKSGFIQRVARGVFVRCEWNVWPSFEFSAKEVAEVKANSFGKQMIEDALDAAVRLRLRNESNQEPTFAIIGRSSSFRFGDTIIHLKAIAPRKMRLGDSKAGKAARALWHLRIKHPTTEDLFKVTQGFLRWDREEYRRSIVWMPAWLSAHICKRRYLHLA